MKSGGPARVLSLAVNIADVDGMLAVRQAVEDSWGGLDTVHIVAGVLSTKTFAASAGSPPKSLSTVAGVARHMNGRARSAFAPAEKAGLEAILDLARSVFLSCPDVSPLLCSLTRCACLCPSQKVD